MIVDTSALVAILRNEPMRAVLSSALQDSSNNSMSAATLLETSIVLGAPWYPILDEALAIAAITIEPVDREQALLARDAYALYGRGNGSKARLNYGDCFSYALAKQRNQPLLFIGDDFTHTDLRSALADGSSSA